MLLNLAIVSGWVPTDKSPHVPMLMVFSYIEGTNLIVIIICNINTYQIITLYTLNLHNAICQLYLHKGGKK